MRNARRYVAPPNAVPRPYGLLSVAQTIEDSDDHLSMGVEYETTGCGTTHATLGECYEAAAEAQALGGGNLTEAERQVLVEGDPFTVYALESCTLVGSGGAGAAEERARRILANGESRGIEAGFEAQVLAVADDLTPVQGTALSPLNALAVLEEYAADNYGGSPTIHVPVGTVTHLGMHTLTARANRLETLQGALVAGGAGYGKTLQLGTEAAPGFEAPAGARWAFVTGAVVVRRGPVEESGLVVDHSRPASNVYHALAQRPVVITHECLSAAVLVQGPVV